MDHDYIVVGAGSSGCAAAGRLSESGEHTVLLLEAGGPDEHEALHVPAAFAAIFKMPMDWAYETDSRFTAMASLTSSRGASTRQMAK